MVKLIQNYCQVEHFYEVEHYYEVQHQVGHNFIMKLLRRNVFSS